jgi:hypothetical protein
LLINFSWGKSVGSLVEQIKEVLPVISEMVVLIVLGLRRTTPRLFHLRIFVDLLEKQSCVCFFVSFFLKNIYLRTHVSCKTIIMPDDLNECSVISLAASSS